MSSEVKISVILPVHGVEPFLKECLNSVLSQSFADYEIILIDDGSKDNSGKICDEYAIKDSRVRVFHNSNHGYAYSVNFGLSESRGEYIIIIEPDDFVEPKMFEKLYDIATKYDADVVKSAFWVYTDLPSKKRDKPIYFDVKENTPFTLSEEPSFLSQHPSIWSCIYKKQFILDSNISFVENGIRSWEDNLFQLKTLLLAKKIIYCNTPFYHWRKNYFFDCDKIRESTLPFHRMLEIYEWLRVTDNANSNILASLHRRDRVYIKLAYQATKWVDRAALFALSKKYVEMVNPDEFKHSPFYKWNKHYSLIKRSPLYFYCYIKLILCVKKFLYRIFQ